MVIARPAAALPRADVEAIVESLDGKVRDGKIAWLTAEHVFRAVSKLFSDAQSSKVRA
jgi:hypothetical protein